MKERDGFDEFITGRSPRLLRIARMLTRDWSAAEDLLQDALTRAWFAWPRLHGDPEPYVRRVIVTSYISQSRRRWRGELPSDDLGEVAGHTDAYRAADERDALWQALGRLPPRQRAVIVLRYYEDLTEVDIAAMLRCSPGTVKSQAARALAKLRVDTSIRDDFERKVTR